MPIWLHIILVVLFVAFFIYRFVKDREVYQILFLVWIPSTLLQYLSDDKTYLLILGGAQILLFILVVYFLFRRSRHSKTKTAQLLADYASGDLDKLMKDRKTSPAEIVKNRDDMAAELEELKKMTAELEQAQKTLEKAVSAYEKLQSENASVASHDESVKSDENAESDKNAESDETAESDKNAESDETAESDKED